MARRKSRGLARRQFARIAGAGALAEARPFSMSPEESVAAAEKIRRIFDKWK